MLQIDRSKNGSTLTITLTGRLDTVTAPQLEAEFKTDMDGVNDVVVDCAALEYVSSAGLRVLLAAYKQMAALGGMKLRAVCEDVMEVFEITGFADIFTIE